MTTQTASWSDALGAAPAGDSASRWRHAGAVFAAGAEHAWRAWCAAIQVFEWIATVGAAMLLVGLWVWFGPGVSLTVIGALLLVLGIAGGRLSATPDPVASEAGPDE